MLKTLTLFSLFFYAFNVASQSPEVIKHSRDNGIKSLGHNLDLYRDSKNFIWNCSTEGIVRYDGAEFVYFQVKDKPDFIATKLTEDPNGLIWTLSLKGELAYLKGSEFHIYSIVPEAKALLKNRQARHFHVDKHTNFFFGTTRNGLLKINSKGEIIRLISQKDGLGVGVWFSEKFPPIPFGITVENDWRIADSISIYNTDLICTKREYFDFENQTPSYRTSIFEISAGITALAFGDFVMKISKQEGVLDFCMVSRIIRTVCVDDNGNWILGTPKNGVIVFPNGNLSPSKKLVFFNGKRVSHIIKDVNGDLWMTILKSGIWQIPSLKILRYNTSNSNLPRNELNFFSTSENKLFVSSTEQYIYEFRDGLFEEQPLLEDNNQLKQSLTSVNSMFYEKQKQRLYVAHGQNLGYLTEKGFNLLNISLPKKMKNSPSYQTIISDYRGGIWAFGRHGGIHIKDDTLKGTAFKNGIYIRTSTAFKDSLIVVGGVKGVFLLENNTYNQFGNKHPIFNSYVNELCNHSGKLWISSSQYGLAYYTNDSLQLLNEKYGLNNVLALKAEADTVWGLDNDHIIKIVDLSGRPIQVEKYWVNFSDEMSFKDFTIFNNKFYISSNEGLMVIGKEELNGERVKSDSKIAFIQINGRDTLLQDNYELDYTQDMIQIGFKNRSFRSPVKRYKYQMSGVDKEWKFTSNPAIQYTNLMPGEYDFQVYTITSENIESEVPAIVVFSIEPPYWRTWWFRILVLIASILIVYAVFQLRVRQVKKREKEKSEIALELARLELKALKAQINPHFIFNSMTTVLLYISKKQSEAAENYLVKFSHMVRKVLETSDKPFVPLDEEMELMNYYVQLESERFKGEKIQFITKYQNLDPKEVKIPPTLIQPYIENSIRHGLKTKQGPRKIAITINKLNNEIKITIKDNGVGRETAHKLNIGKKVNKSMGMRISSRRIQILNKEHLDKLTIIDMKDDEGNATGTSVTFFVPLKFV